MRRHVRRRAGLRAYHTTAPPERGALSKTRTSRGLTACRSSAARRKPKCRGPSRPSGLQSAGKIQPCQHRLAALRDDRNLISRRKASFQAPQNILHGLVRHDAERAHLAQIFHIAVKAVSAPEVAKRRRRLEHHVILLHALPPCAGWRPKTLPSFPAVRGRAR